MSFLHFVSLFICFIDILSSTLKNYCHQRSRAKEEIFNETKAYNNS